MSIPVKKSWMNNNWGSNNRGDILVSVLVFAAIAVAITTGLVSWGTSLIKTVRLATQREQAFQIAEAGVDYYRWHLAQFPTDYKDGTSGNGPYVHTFTDKAGNVIGKFSLTVTPPPVGSTKVIINSVGTYTGTTTGTSTGSLSIVRKIQATMAIPSLAQYAVVANDNMRFGAGTNVYGPIRSNYGIRFDGVAYNVISSAKSTYTDPDTGLIQYGVYTGDSPSDPQPPGVLSARADIFKAGRQFPVPSVDFAGLSANLQQLETAAIASNSRYTQSQYRGSAVSGYHLTLNTNGTYTLKVVRTLVSAPNNCSNASNQTQWGTWSIGTEALLGTYSYPTSGVIFFEDDVWVDGQVNGNRLTIAAGKFPQQVGSEPNITVNNDLMYTNTDGSDIVGLVAQGNINVGLVSDDNLRIDAALISENGRVGRFYYGSNCIVNNTDYHVRSTLTANGMIATNVRYGFAYTDGTGYQTRNLNYDGNLLYSPPPSFPLASSQYQMISWKEVQ